MNRHAEPHNESTCSMRKLYICKSTAMHLFLEEPDDRIGVVYISVGFHLQLELTEEVVHVDVGTVTPHCGVSQQLIQSLLSCSILIQLMHHVQQLRLICHGTLAYHC